MKFYFSPEYQNFVRIYHNFSACGDFVPRPPTRSPLLDPAAGTTVLSPPEQDAPSRFRTRFTSMLLQVQIGNGTRAFGFGMTLNDHCFHCVAFPVLVCVV